MAGVVLTEQTAARLAKLLAANGGMGGPRSPMSYQGIIPPWTRFHNGTDETIPPFAIMQPDGLTDAPDAEIVTVAQWDGEYPGPFLFNGRSEVEAGKTGTAQFGPVFRCLYSGDVEDGAMAGPADGEWHVVAATGCPAVHVFGVLDEADSVLVGTASLMTIRHVKAPSGGIPARVAEVQGTASCEIYRTLSDGVTLEATGASIAVVNWGVDAACVNGERYGIAGWTGEVWKIISEDCADDQEGTVASRSLTVGTTAPSEAFATDPSPSFIYPKRVTPKFTIPLGLSYSA